MGKTGKFAEDTEIDCKRSARLAVGVVVLFTLFVIRSSDSDTRKAHICLNFPQLHSGLTLDLERDAPNLIFHNASALELNAACFRREFELSGADRISYEAHTISFDPKGMTLDGNRIPIEEVKLVYTTDGKFVTA